MLHHNNSHGVRTYMHFALVGFVLAAGPLALGQSGKSPSGKPPVKVSSRDLVEKKVRRIVAQQLAVDPKRVIPKARLREDLGADTISLLDLSEAFQKAFNLPIRGEDMKALNTVQDAVDYISNHIIAVK